MRKIIFIGVFSVLLLLSACIGAPADDPEASQPGISTPAPINPGMPTAVSHTNGNHDEEPTASSSEVESAVVNDPALENHLIIQDKNATGDLLMLNLKDVPPAPSGQNYQGWLVNLDGSVESVGVLSVQDNDLHLEWAAPNGDNLYARIKGFQITLEPSGGSAQPTGAIKYEGFYSQSWLQLISALFVRNDGEPATPRLKPFAPSMKSQTYLAVQHVENALNAAAIGALEETRNHVEHFINIMEGSHGERLKDYNGDGTAQNPGDGFGALSYARQAVSQINAAGLAPEAATQLAQALSDYEAAVLEAEEQAAAIFAISEIGEMNTRMNELVERLRALLAGPTNQLYQAIQQAAALPMQPAR